MQGAAGHRQRPGGPAEAAQHGLRLGGNGDDDEQPGLGEARLLVVGGASGHRGGRQAVWVFSWKYQTE